MSAQYLLIGLDGKVDWQQGRMRCLPPGNDALLVLDIGTDPACPRIVARLPLSNSVFGPPSNLSLTPDQRLALVADSMEWLAQPDGRWQPTPGRNVHVLTLDTQGNPTLQQTLEVGLQPSGLAINRAGTLALVANRAGQSVSVLRIAQGQVTVLDEVALGSPAAAVAFTADGQHALVAKMNEHRLAVLHIDDEQVRYDPVHDIVTGLVPFNVVVTPDGSRALTVDMGHPNATDGHVDTVSVVDLTQQPYRVVDRIVVGDGPEGLCMSPDGRHAAVAVVQGCNEPPQSWVHHPLGRVVLLHVQDGRVQRTDSADTGVLPEGLAFSACGQYLYVGNYMDQQLQVFAVRDGRLQDCERVVELGGYPASMRTQSL